MTTDAESPYRVPFDGTFSLRSCPTAPPADAGDRKTLTGSLARSVDAMDDLQRALYAEDRKSLLCVFQAMDAAGKDSTIRAVFSGLNPAGFQISAFKKPSAHELDHDFLWRSVKVLPERGRIGVFNRSYYEEVLVVRVHPGLLKYQRIDLPADAAGFWAGRLASIRDHEEHLARNGTTILKFFLNVSLDVQRDRFLARLDEPKKRWKFNPGDVAERQRWVDYMDAYQQALAATSRRWAPWFAVPADDKPFMRATVADIVRKTLEEMAPRYPTLSPDDEARIPEWRAALEG